jgi:uncharacterized protein
MGRGSSGLIGGALVALGIALAAPAPAGPVPLGDYPQGSVTLSRDGRTGSAHRFRVWVAATPEHREQGLMFVRTLAPDRGMLFVFASAQPVSFWMKNTYISLDLLFIGADGRVLRVAENATPLSTESISSMGPAAWVLELAGGSAKRLGLAPGDRMLYQSSDAH